LSTAWHDLAVAATLALLDMDQHPVAVVVSKTRLRHDTADPEIADLDATTAKARVNFSF
jgi:hypothetical protein